MSLKDKIANDLKAAFLGGDRFVSDTLKGLKAAILNQEIAIGKRDEGLSDDEVEVLVQKEIKKRKESAEIYQQAGRTELAEKELAEAEVLARYLPAQLSVEEIEALAREIMTELNLDANPKNQGIIIGNIKKRAGSAVDGGQVAQIVKKLIEN